MTCHSGLPSLPTSPVLRASFSPRSRLRDIYAENRKGTRLFSVHLLPCARAAIRPSIWSTREMIPFIFGGRIARPCPVGVIQQHTFRHPVGFCAVFGRLSSPPNTSFPSSCYTGFQESLALSCLQVPFHAVCPFHRSSLAHPGGPAGGHE